MFSSTFKTSLLMTDCFYDAVLFALQGFYCGSEDEFNGLCKKIRQHFMTSDVQTPIFEVQEHKLPVHITSLSSQPGLCLSILDGP